MDRIADGLEASRQAAAVLATQMATQGAKVDAIAASVAAMTAQTAHIQESVATIERVVIHGNGQPSMMRRLTEAEGDVRVLARSVEKLAAKVSGLSASIEARDVERGRGRAAVWVALISALSGLAVAALSLLR